MIQEVREQDRPAKAQHAYSHDIIRAERTDTVQLNIQIKPILTNMTFTNCLWCLYHHQAEPNTENVSFQDNYQDRHRKRTLVRFLQGQKKSQFF